MRRLINLLFVVGSLVSICAPTSADNQLDLVIYTENYPPYNFQDEAGEVSGLATQNVRQIMDATGLTYEIRLVPWKTAVDRVRATPNALIYSITRTPSRERDYSWLVLLAPSSFYIYVRSDDRRLITMDGIRAGQFQGACYGGDITCEIFRVAGLPADRLTIATDKNTGDFELVRKGQADLFISEYAANERLRRQAGYDPAITKPVLRIGEAAGFFLAGNKALPAHLKDRILDSYQAILKAGTYKLVDADAR